MKHNTVQCYCMVHNPQTTPQWEKPGKLLVTLFTSFTAVCSHCIWYKITESHSVDLQDHR